MADAVTLLFLHGVGDGDPDGDALRSLDKTLQSIGYSGLSDVKVVAPKYAHALRGWDDKVAIPPMRTRGQSGDERKRNRREFERRIGAIEHRLGWHDPGIQEARVDALVGLAIQAKQMIQAKKYVEDPQVRSHVLRAVLDQCPTAGPLVVVGHSLGSVIAADLLTRLSPDVEIRACVTIGSPLAHAPFAKLGLAEVLAEPPTNLGWWINFWNSWDLVSAQRGLSSVAPWLIDRRVNVPDLPLGAHAATTYFASEPVAEAIAFGVFGSKSRELARIERSPDVPLDAAETIALMALRFAQLVRERLSGDIADRYEGALRQVQSTTIEEALAGRRARSSQIPALLADLWFDFGASGAERPSPSAFHHLAKTDAVVALTVLTSENPIRPFEIDVPEGIRRTAMQELTAEMGLGSKFGSDLFEATAIARRELSRTPKNWLRMGAIGAGVVALVVATGGLAAAAGAGLAGAAAITSALAGFGPGGMVGGLLTAGALASAGGGGIAYGLASPATSAEALAAVVERRLAAEVLRKLQGLDPDPSVWATLARIEIEVRREHERQDEFSDPDSAGLKELKRKVVTVERALDYLRKNGLEPSADALSNSSA